MNYCEYPPNFYTEDSVVARKGHRCCECRNPIRVGTRHMKMTGCWDGRVESFRQHMACWTFARKLGGVDPPRPSDKKECIPFGCIGEHVAEIWYRDDPIAIEWESIVEATK